ncbi:MAG: asparagine synthetase B [Anaerolineae bacterium]|nr:asparagine synthetase B [Anaerolineae bacterium]
MSGLAGIHYFDQRPVAEDDLQRMIASLHHRGPDRSAIWHCGPTGLAHCMLWTTPESLHETLPLVDSGGQLAITADARLDNRTELISALNLIDQPPQTLSDSQLILAAYAKWGDACPAKLIGDFAFVIWDGRRRQLICARDFFGVKPLYYYYGPGIFTFASEIKALLTLPEVPRRLNEARVADYLMERLEEIDKTSTFYQEIYRFPPGQTLVIEGSHCRWQTHFRLDPGAEIRCRSDEEYTAAFLEVFSEAVRCRLRSAYPMASMLSGGLDSSAIVGLARQMVPANGQGRLHTLSAISNEGVHCLETTHTRAVLNQGHVEAHTIRPDQLSQYTAELDETLHHCDDLFDHLIWHVPLSMYLLARRYHLRAVLDGIDGDMVASLSTTHHINYLIRAGRWPTAVREAMGLQTYGYSARNLLYYNSLSHLSPYIPAVLKQIRRKFSSERDLFQEAIAGTIINPDFARNVNVTSRLQQLYENFDTTHCSTLTEATARFFKAPRLTVGIERYGRIAAQQGVEPRHPLLDTRLVQFCLALPWSQKINRGHTKIILRRAMAGRLPESVCWRTGKEHLGPDFFEAWLQLKRDFINEIMAGQLNRISAYVDISAVRAAYRRCLQANQWTEDGFPVWQAVTLTYWLSRHKL